LFLKFLRFQTWLLFLHCQLHQSFLQNQRFLQNQHFLKNLHHQHHLRHPLEQAEHLWKLVFQIHQLLLFHLRRLQFPMENLLRLQWFQKLHHHRRHPEHHLDHLHLHYHLRPKFLYFLDCLQFRQFQQHS
jgi:hypothetical protein